jgi:hypothetical protein
MMMVATASTASLVSTRPLAASSRFWFSGL